jgi:hypothetical protein
MRQKRNEAEVLRFKMHSLAVGEADPIGGADFTLPQTNVVIT